MPEDAAPGSETPTDAAEIAELRTKVAELSRESASYRTQRNDALRRSHAFETMLSAHSIDTSGVTAEALERLPIANGAVDGKFAYEAPKLNPGKAPARETETAAPAALTRETVKGMTPDEINSRWPEIKAWMAQGGSKA